MSAQCEPISIALIQQIRSFLSYKGIVLAGGSLAYDAEKEARVLYLTVESRRGGSNVDIANIRELKEIPEVENAADCVLVNGSSL